MLAMTFRTPPPVAAVRLALSFLPTQTCTVDVTFKPVYPGQRVGAVVLIGQDGTALGTEYLSGSATGGIGAFVPGTINTVAGNQAWIYSGDNVQATASSIFIPFGIALNAAGDMFIADTSNDRIRKVTKADGTATGGIITTIAGNGIIAASGDGGPATSASVNNPSSVALDGAGNIFFTDSGNNAVRRIDANTGIITTFAGTLGQHGFSGDGGPSNLATLNTPNGIAFDAAGNLYIADTGNNLIRKVTAATGFISTFAGNNSQGFSGDGGAAAGASLNAPWSVTPAPSGMIYIADQGNNRIRSVDTAGIIRTIVGTGAAGYSGDGGAASAAQLNVPANVAIDVGSNLYISDSGNNVIRKVNPTTQVINTVAGNSTESISGDNGPATQAGLYGPYTLALDGVGNLYIADVFHNRIREITTSSATLEYQPIRVNRTSTPQSQTFENDGNATLNISAINAVSNATIDGSTTSCSIGAPLDLLQSCTVGVAFAPTMTGTPTLGSVSIASDAANAPSAITLTGNVLDIDPSTVVLVSTTPSSTVGQSVTFNVIVTSQGVTPTGTVTLMEAGNPIGSPVTLASGNATFTVSTLSGGQHTLVAAYSGDSNNTSGNSNTIVQTVKEILAATVTTMFPSANPIDAGATLKLNASVTVAVAGTGTGTLSGSVVFNDGNIPLGTGIISNGVASFTLNTLTVGTHNLTATYNGDSNYDKSTSSQTAEIVRLATSTVSLSSTANPSVAGIPPSLFASVVTTGGVPTGSVSFLDGSTVLGKASLNGQGQATFPLQASLSVGVHSFTAVYSGDAADATQTSSPYLETVNIASTSVLLNSSLNPSAQGGPVQFTAKVQSSGGAPTGAVNFFDGTAPIGSGTINAQGFTSITTLSLAVGTHQITAAYQGDPLDGTSTSAPTVQVINPATDSILLGSSANPQAFASAVILSVKVSGTGSQPTGNVTLLDGATPLGTTPVDGNGNASFTETALSIGTHNLVANYAGDANHSAISSTVLVEQILQVTTTVVTTSAATDIGGKPVTFTATVAGVSNQPVTGSVRFVDNGSTVATMPLDNSGGASYSSSKISVGTHPVSAVYSGDALNQPSTSKPLVEVINIATTSVTLSSNANPNFSTDVLTLTSTVTTNGGAPTGTVTFFDGNTSLGAEPVSATGVATLSTNGLQPGIHLLTAVYNGDALDATSTSGLLKQQIAQKTSVLITSSANPSLLTQNVTINAAVTSGGNVAPTGTVILTDGSTAVGTASLNGAGIATFQLTAPALGQHVLTAIYSGDNGNLAATSPTFTQVVTLWPSTNTFTASSTALSAGQTVTFVSIVQGTAPRAPTGSVTFVSGSTVLGTAALNATGVATLTIHPTDPANLNVVSEYPGDSLYAASSSAATAIIVGPTVEFTIDMTPASLTMVSGAHATLQLTINSAATFTDTLALGCAGLPAYATCTFSTNSIKLAGGVVQKLSVVVDSGDPLGAGPTVTSHNSSGPLSGASNTTLACMLPAGAFFGLMLWKARKHRTRFAGLLMVLGLCSSAMLSGCANSFSMDTTPAGSYTFRIVGTGNSTGATQSGDVALTVTAK